MSDRRPRAANQSIPSSVKKDEADVTERVERTDVGASIEVTITRGTGTRDQEKIKAKTKGETVSDARDDMDELRPWIREFADDVRSWQPEESE